MSSAEGVARADLRDFFISHAGSDERWASWIGQQLLAAGHTVELDVWDWAAGDDFVEAMERALGRAHRVLAVWSSAYFRSPYAGAEFRSGLFASSTGNRRRVIPILVEECQIPELYQNIIFINLVGANAEHARTRLIEGIKAPSAPIGNVQFPTEITGVGIEEIEEPAMQGSELTTPSSIPIIWNVPARSIYFTGREAELTAIGEILRLGQSGNAAAWPRVALTALRGMGGVGKTQLAIEFAHRNAYRYAAVWWLFAERSSLLLQGLAELGNELGLIPGSNVEVQARRTLSHLAQRKDWLLIYDNVEGSMEAVSRWLPSGQGHVMLTSRDPAVGRLAPPIQITEFARHESVELLRRRSPRLSEGEAELIAEAVGNLPLPIEQAGAYLDETGMKVDLYLQLLAKRPIDSGIFDDNPVSHPGVVSTITTSLDQLAVSHPAALSLFEKLGFFAPEPILIATAFDRRGDGGSLGIDIGEAGDVGKIIHAIISLALARSHETSLQIHRIVQSVTRNRLNPEQRVATCLSAANLSVSADPGEPQDPDSWPTYSWLTPHLQTLWIHGEEENLTFSNSFRELIIRAAFYLRVSGRIRLAREISADISYRLREHLGPDHPDCLLAANVVAESLRDLGDYEPAYVINEDTLQRRRRAIGPDHPETFNSAGNVALCLRALGRHAEAKTLNEEIYERRRAVLGPSHRDTLISASNLALDLHDLGLYEEAARLSEEALWQREEVLGPEHPETLRSMANLGSDLRELGNLSRAQELDDKALRLRQKVIGEEHHDTLISMSHVASNFHELGDRALALQISEDVLKLRSRVLGEDHADTLKSVSQLARDELAIGNTDAALVLNDRALQTRERTLGADHPNTGRSAMFLALTLHELHRDEEALTFARRAAQVLTQALGESHPDTRRAVLLRQELGENLEQS